MSIGNKTSRSLNDVMCKCPRTKYEILAFRDSNISVVDECGSNIIQILQILSIPLGFSCLFKVRRFVAPLLDDGF